jgi:hypothetical protein
MVEDVAILVAQLCHKFEKTSITPRTLVLEKGRVTRMSPEGRA